VTVELSPRMQALAVELANISAGHSGTCTWALTDLESGEHIGHDEDAVMPPASLAKVPILVTLYRAAQDGNLRLDDRIRYEEQHRSLGSGVLARMSFGVEMTARDAHWMARKLAEITPEHLRAIVREGQFSDPRAAEYLIRALVGRRSKLLDRYLLTWTPLSRPRAEGRELCFDDVATIGGVTAPLLRPMTHRATLDGRQLRVHAGPHGEVCATIPSGSGYRQVKVEGHISDEPGWLPPVEIHFVDRGGEGLLVVGVERRD